MNPISIDAALDVALDGILNERLVLLAGAGLSMAEPSGLPSAATLASKAKSEYDARYGGIRDALPDSIDDQAEFFFQRRELGSVFLKTYVDQHVFASQPNAGHLAVADLLLSNGLRAGVTTNVDILIEGAGIMLLGQIFVGIDGHQVDTSDNRGFCRSEHPERP